MPARDLYHDTVKNALVKDGWTITHDPFKLPVGIRDSFVDLGAQKLVAAEKGTPQDRDPDEEVIVRWIP